MILALLTVVVSAFAIGFAMGESVGWDRCWQDLTKDDAWRKEQG